MWQHCDCVKADDTIENYLCERCEPREVNLEIIIDPQPEYATGLLIFLNITLVYTTA